MGRPQRNHINQEIQRKTKMKMRWTSEECREIARRLKWPTSLLPDIPHELERVYGFNPPYGRVLTDINREVLVRDIDKKTGMPVMCIRRMAEEPRYALGQTVWLVSDDHVVKKFTVLNIRKQITQYAYKPPVFMKTREVINAYRLETDRHTVYDRGSHVWEDSLYKDELHARIQADDELKVKIAELEDKLQMLRKRRDQNARRIKKLEKEHAGY